MKEKIRISTVIMLGIIFIGFASVAYQLLAKNIGYDLLGIQNEWFLKSIKTDDNLGEPVAADRNWAQEYPLPETAGYTQRKVESTRKKAQTAQIYNFSVLDKIYTMLEKYTSDYFTFNTICERVSKQFDILLGTRLNTDAYGVNQLFLPNGHMTYERPYKSLDDEIENIRSFSSWLSDEKIKYFHVIIPAPVGNQEDELNVQRAGYQVYSNQMADEFKEALELYHIDCVDIRDYMIEDNKSYTDSFFRYEHHMVPSAGIWVAGIVSDHIDERMEQVSDSRIFDISNYSVTEAVKKDGLMNDKLFVYEGKEEIEFLHPDFLTDIDKYIADYDMLLSGRFDDVMYADWYYPRYNTWNHGIDAIKTYRNNLITTGEPKILLLTESYSDVISPFLACAYANIDEIDLRIFTGSLQAYIEQTEPDIVISMYSAYDFNSAGADTLYEFE